MSPGIIDQHAWLYRLIGRWRGSEVMSQTPWAAAGEAESLVEAELALGGAFLFQDYRQSRDGAPSFAARSVFGLGKTAGQALMYHFDTMGFMPTAPAAGAIEGDELVFTRHSPRGRGQHRFTFDGDGTYRLTLLFAPPDGLWSPVMTGHYQSIPST